MAFINEYVSPEDFEKYGFKVLNRKCRIGDEQTQWTVDKLRDIYIRRIPQGGPSDGSVHMHMFWHGKLFKVFVIYKSTHVRGLRGMELPPELLPFRDEIVSDLKEALIVYGEFGVLSQTQNFKITFDF